MVAFSNELLWELGALEPGRALRFAWGGFPGLVNHLKGAALIRGEVHQYENLHRLDGIEGYDAESPKEGLYNRLRVRPHDDDYDMGECWVYVFNARRREPLDLIESGDWFFHRGLYKKGDFTRKKQQRREKLN